uniref:Uncharacterized protein n=1 Tax=Mycena chlorophos TaxID=658473 RepID=A0ABQ0KW55_MYCCL|nr:predicted protein [Mycena chlorophos]
MAAVQSHLEVFAPRRAAPFPDSKLRRPAAAATTEKRAVDALSAPPKIFCPAASGAVPRPQKFLLRSERHCAWDSKLRWQPRFAALPPLSSIQPRCWRVLRTALNTLKCFCPAGSGVVVGIRTASTVAVTATLVSCQVALSAPPRAYSVFAPWAFLTSLILASKCSYLQFNAPRFWPRGERRPTRASNSPFTAGCRPGATTPLSLIPKAFLAASPPSSGPLSILCCFGPAASGTQLGLQIARLRLTTVSARTRGKDTVVCILQAILRIPAIQLWASVESVLRCNPTPRRTAKLAPIRLTRVVLQPIDSGRKVSSLNYADFQRRCTR